MMRGGSMFMKALCILFMLATLAACAGVSGNQGAKNETVPVLIPALTAVPAVGEPESEFTCYGANFGPEQKLRVVMMTFPEIENVLGAKAEGLALKADKLGSFAIKAGLPGKEGIYPIRVYDEEERPLAATLVVVKKKPPKKE